MDAGVDDDEAPIPDDFFEDFENDVFLQGLVEPSEQDQHVNESNEVDACLMQIDQLTENIRCREERLRRLEQKTARRRTSRSRSPTEISRQGRHHQNHYITAESQRSKNRRRSRHERPRKPIISSVSPTSNNEHKRSPIVDGRDNSVSSDIKERHQRPRSRHDRHSDVGDDLPSPPMPIHVATVAASPPTDLSFIDELKLTYARHGKEFPEELTMLTRGDTAEPTQIASTSVSQSTDERPSVHTRLGMRSPIEPAADGQSDQNIDEQTASSMVEPISDDDDEDYVDGENDDELDDCTGASSGEQRDRNERKCWNCKLASHIAKDCPSPLLKCSNCQRIGHAAENCRALDCVKKIADGEDVELIESAVTKSRQANQKHPIKCFNCKLHGHQAHDCPSPLIICTACLMFGHYVHNCSKGARPKKIATQVERAVVVKEDNAQQEEAQPRSAKRKKIKKCHNCNVYGHEAASCLLPIIRCSVCHLLGHVAKDCGLAAEEPKKPTGEKFRTAIEMRKRKCYNCNTNGHHAIDCTLPRSERPPPPPMIGHATDNLRLGENSAYPGTRFNEDRRYDYYGYDERSYYDDNYYGHQEYEDYLRRMAYEDGLFHVRGPPVDQHAWMQYYLSGSSGIPR